MPAEEQFEELVTTRLAAEADAAVGNPPVPLAELRRAGQRRLRARRGWQLAAAVVLVAGSTALGAGLSGHQGRAVVVPAVSSTPSGTPSPSPSYLVDPSYCTGSDRAPVPAAGPSGLPNDPVVDAAAGVADGLGRGAYRASYTGVCVEPWTHTLFVYRVRGSDFDSVLTARVAKAGLTLRFVDAKHSKQQEDALVQRVVQDGAYWRSKGVQVTDTSARYDGTGVVVGVVGADAARAAMLARYGGMVSVVEHTPIVAA
ncbi:hypothetical protein CFP65_4630 [Kitasatospora sp. MMS16-BH015]|uniref:hypothetical protein n=1 Tax=Kitasatospora sp. MMS16-BH015 TaxID=2018025 RepID=UPI000CA1589C|nr:hypothetical protein [Kitasatospora sp. MMS16-BH015]AUG79364.1 hypothetical protein CFP65_4630 [Kitasatospora sp. MMS16-BH015]